MGCRRREKSWTSALRHASACVSLMVLAAACLALCSCGVTPGENAASSDRTSKYLTFLDTEPASADPQCISTNYTVPLNIFDRLVEVDEESGDNSLKPSLASSWEVSSDRLVYTFHLREGVTFSNGSPLTASDVGFTLKRLITHPDSLNRDLAMCILGAEQLRGGTADELAGFQIVDDYTFAITLERPFGPFMAGLSTPGASILDEQSTLAAGDSFGKEVGASIGTGPFVLSEWNAGKSIVLTANERWWAGAPRCQGLKMLFYSDTDSMTEMYESGQIDILDLDRLGMDADYFLRGDVYRTNVIRGRRVGISYVALNESIAPLNDVRVRKALQLSLNRDVLLEVGINGTGTLEDGIFPQGLVGHNPDLPKIAYNPEQAASLLEAAGYGGGFNLQVEYPESSTQSVKDLLNVMASMWGDIGIRADVVELKDDVFAERRKNGELTCYTATWSADYNDPDNFMYTFFGNGENSRSRSLCYADEQVMKRVQDARYIVNDALRIGEYQALEQKIVQEDAAWIPLYSKLHFFLVGDRVDGFKVRWNGWSSNRYDDVAIVDAEG